MNDLVCPEWRRRKNPRSPKNLSAAAVTKKVTVSQRVSTPRLCPHKTKVPRIEICLVDLNCNRHRQQAVIDCNLYTNFEVTPQCFLVGAS